MVKTKLETGVIEYRAEKIKGLYEKRAQLQEELEEILAKAKEENRAMDEGEMTRFEEAEAEIEGIDKTIDAQERFKRQNTGKGTDSNDKDEVKEERAFEAFVRNTALEERAGELAKSDNGAIVPSKIVGKIIELVKEISPIYNLATKFNVKGALTFPVYDETQSKITCTYAEEFQKLTSSSAEFKSETLAGYLAGALSKISKSLVNNTEFRLVPYIVQKVAEAISEWLEKELLTGNANKIQGLITSTYIVEAGNATTITVDDLIDTQEEVPDKFQNKAVWIMNKDTRKAIRKLKDADGNLILNRDVTAKWGYTLLGKDVYTSDNMPKMEAGKMAIAYGEMSGLYVKLVENIEVDILREKYADEHAIGVVGWIEADAKIIEKQKIAILKMKEMPAK